MARPKTNKVRSTIFVDPDLIAALDHIARIEAVKQGKNISRTEVIHEAVSEYKQKWEKKNGEIKPK